MPTGRAELPRSEAPLSDTERGKIVGEFQDWVFTQLGQLPTVHAQLFDRFKGPDFNTGKKDSNVFAVRQYRVDVRNNIGGNRHGDDSTVEATRQLVLRVRPVADTWNPSDYFTIYSVCEYEGDPKTDEVKKYTDGELQLYATDEAVKTLIGDPEGVVEASKTALTRVFFGSDSDTQTP